MFPGMVDKVELLTFIRDTFIREIALLELGDYVVEKPLHIRLLRHLDEGSTVKLPTKSSVENLGKCSFTNTTRSNYRYHLELLVPIVAQPLDKLTHPPINN